MTEIRFSGITSPFNRDLMRGYGIYATKGCKTPVGGKNGHWFKPFRDPDEEYPRPVKRL